jgi:hypothetical protein
LPRFNKYRVSKCERHVAEPVKRVDKHEHGTILARSTPVSLQSIIQMLEIDRERMVIITGTPLVHLLCCIYDQIMGFMGEENIHTSRLEQKGEMLALTMGSWFMAMISLFMRMESMLLPMLVNYKIMLDQL